MPQRVIIAGGGRIGARTAAILDTYGHDTVVIERDDDRCDRLGAFHRGATINGDATRPGVLSQAAPDRADVFAALTGDERTNRELCERVGPATGGPRTVARVEDTGTRFDRVDRTVQPAVAGARATATAVLDGGYELHDCPAEGFDLVEFAADPAAPAARREVGDLALPEGCRVVADTERMRVARPDTSLTPGARYLVAVDPGNAATARNLLRG